MATLLSFLIFNCSLSSASKDFQSSGGDAPLNVEKGGAALLALSL
jgi:hypothetical protein